MARLSWRAAPTGRQRQQRSTTDALITRTLELLNALVPKDPDRIVVHSQPDFEDGALAVLTELHERGHRPTVLCEDRAAAKRAPQVVGWPIEAVGKNSPRGRRRYLTAGVVITTHGAYRSQRPPRSQLMVNLWHGEPLTKPVGRWDRSGPVPSTWATALSNVGKAFRCAEFDLDPAQVLVVGAPRNDRMLTADPAASRARVPEAAGIRRLILWLPTYRSRTWSGRIDGKAYSGTLPLSDDEMAELDAWLVANDSLVLAKPHPLSRPPEVGRYQRIVNIGPEWLVEHELSLYTLLATADCLVTDVSSVWIDYLLLDRPMIFAFPDLDAYRRTRGLHLEPYDEWIPGPLVADGAGLLAELDRLVAGEDRYVRDRRQALVRLHAHHDAGSTRRLLDAIGL
jgi:CDP-glycerol glycerophosphotransferase